MARTGQIRFVNQDLGGATAEEVAGTSIYDWVFPEQQAVLRGHLERVFVTGEPQVHDLAGLSPDRPDVWYECRIAPTRRSGEIVSATIIARDVTVHRRAQLQWEQRYAQLSRSYEERAADLATTRAELAQLRDHVDADPAALTRFRALVDAAGEAIFVTDALTGRILDLNETACRWLRGQRDELLGRNAAELHLQFPILLPEEHDLQFTETRDSRRPIMVVGSHRRQDGTAYPVEVAIARHRLGERTYVLAVARDAKERAQGQELLQQRERAYHDLFQHASDAIFLTTRTGQIAAVNRAAIDLFGYTPEEFVGLDARLLFPRADDIRRYQEEMAAHGVVRSLSLEMRRKDGTSFTGLLSATRRQSTDRSVQGYQCLVRRGDPGSSPATPLAGATGQPDAVLVVDADPQARTHVGGVLERAGMRVLLAEHMARALDLLREHAGRLTAVTLGVDAGEGGVEHTVEEFHRIDPRAPVIVCSAEDRLALASRLAELRIAGHLDRRPHPLVLVQKVREAAAAPSHTRSSPPPPAAL